MAKTIKKDYRKSTLPLGKNSAMLANNLTLVVPEEITLQKPISIATSTSGFTLQDLINAQEAAKIEKKRRYDFLLSTSLDRLTADGYFVDVTITDSANGSIFYGTPNAASAYLAIQDIQEIENALGTPGALLMHMQQPEIAKDTAGYDGGNSTTFSRTDPVVDPIPEVQTLPPVVKTPDGTVSFDPVATPYGTDPTTGTVTEAGMTGSGSKYYWLWYVGAIVVIIIYLKYGRK
jgi:hypothetical protein